MRFHVPSSSDIQIHPEVAVIAGFTARDRQRARAHLRELADEGVPVPDKIPTFYTVPGDLLLQTERLEVAHERTSGEAEAVLLLPGDGDVHVTLGSDHTDRVAETEDIAASKLACPKVLADEAWPLPEVIEGWDELELRSWISIDGRRELYQRGTLAELIRPQELLERIHERQSHLISKMMIFTGTLAAQGGIRPADQFDAELRDPSRGRTIELSYRVDITRRTATGSTS